MEDEILRRKYYNLRSKLYNIENRLESIEESYNDLKNKINESFLIDDKIVKQTLFKSLGEECQDIYNELSNRIIPRINNKI